jgi:hypothetical protein
VEGFDPEHGQSVAAAPRGDFFRKTGKKKPQHMAGVLSLFAVTHQGPAQGGKAGGTKVPSQKYIFLGKKVSNFLFCLKKLFYVL